jgi:hypothetical protein
MWGQSKAVATTAGSPVQLTKPNGATAFSKDFALLIQSLIPIFGSLPNVEQVFCSTDSEPRHHPLKDSSQGVHLYQKKRQSAAIVFACHIFS